MKPVENYEAETAFKQGKKVYILDRTTTELFVLNAMSNQSFLSGVFLDGRYIYYVEGE